jgi:hypothetical protein
MLFAADTAGTEYCIRRGPKRVFENLIMKSLTLLAVQFEAR